MTSTGAGTNDDAHEAQTGGDSRVFRRGGISYVHIPADDARASAAFYRAVFGWNVRGDPDAPSFDDGTGHVIGSWVTGRPAAHHSGVVLYVYVDVLDDTLARATAQGAGIIKPPYPEGDVSVAVISDPAGNEIGIWQRGPR
jgi:predicted enzyme related to lactoylglutathione lyase